MNPLISRIVAGAVRFGVVALLSGIASGMLVCFSPGAGLTEQELNFHRNSESMIALRKVSMAEASLPTNIRQILIGIGDGTLGNSTQYGMPVFSLLQSTLRSTAPLVVCGSCAGWVLAVFFVAGGLRWRWLAWVGETSSLTLLLLPAAALACFFGLTRALTPLACVTAAVFSALLPPLAVLGRRAAGLRSTCFASANGMSLPQTLLYAMAPSLGRELRSLLGITLNVAIGAAFVTEAVCDLPGLGGLAIHSAMARDAQPVMVISAILCAVTSLANPRPRKREEST